MSRRAERFFSEDRWFLTGMSAAFLDPLFSSGSAFLTEANRMIGDLIATELAGDGHAVKNKVVAYNAHANWWLDNFLLHITGNYHGSYDLMRQLFEPLLMDYFGLVLPSAMARDWGYEPGQEYDPVVLRERKKAMLESSAGMAAHHIADQLGDYLRGREGLFSNNAGKFFDLKITRGYIQNSQMRGATLSSAVIQAVQAEMLELSVTMALRRMAQSAMRCLDETRLPGAIRDIGSGAVSLVEGFEAISAPIDALPPMSAARHTVETV